MTEAFRAHCPRCHGNRVCIIHGEFDQPWSIEEGRNHIEGAFGHKLVQCAGCETVFYYKTSWHDQDWRDDYHPVTGEPIVFYPRKIETYPAPEKKSQKPDWVWGVGQVDPQLYTILFEVYQAYEVESFILASVGLRTALDRTTEFLNIDPGHSLERKVKELLENGFIGETEAETLAIVVDAGNAAAHRGWAPDREMFKTLITTLEHFIYRVVVTGKAALKLTENIPARQPRPKKQPTKPT